MNIVDIDVPEGKKFTICGDIHGQYYDLMNIFELNGMPSEENPYLFNGDFVDRGSFSVECIFVLFGFKLLYPNHFFMSRGNHESENMNKMYGFEGEVKSKYSANMVDLFTEVYNWLPLSHCINNKIIVMHGGLFSKVITSFYIYPTGIFSNLDLFAIIFGNYAYIINDVSSNPNLPRFEYCDLIPYKN